MTFGLRHGLQLAVGNMPKSYEKQTSVASGPPKAKSSGRCPTHSTPSIFLFVFPEASGWSMRQISACL